MQLSQISGHLESCVFHTLGKRSVIKRHFYTVTVINVKCRGKFCFPNWCSPGLFFFPPLSLFIDSFQYEEYNVSCETWNCLVALIPLKYAVCINMMVIIFTWHAHLSLLFCIVLLHKATVMKVVNGTPFFCTFSFSEKDI